MMGFFATNLLLLLSITVETQPVDQTVIKDLKDNWKIYSNSQYIDYDRSKFNRTIYFSLDADRYKGSSIRIESKGKFSVFIGGRLVISQEKGAILYDLDSLAKLYSNPLHFSILRPAVDISTKLIIKNADQSEDRNLVKRGEQYFLDFSIIASLTLLLFFVILLKTNPKLTADYLNFGKLFSVHEHEENVLAIRITSVVNLLYFTLTSLLSAFLVMVIFHFAFAELSLANHFQVASLQEAFLQWLWLSSLILGILLGKLVLIGALTYLYRATEIMALQFFNFIRLFLFAFGVIAILLVCFLWVT